MSVTDKKELVRCPRCQASITFWQRPVIDAARDAERYRAFLADTLDPKTCICGLKLDLETPTTLVCDHWIGLALENPERITAAKAFEIIEVMVPDLQSKPILVVGRSEELRRMTQAKAADPFCCHRLDLMLLPNIDTSIEVWRDIADAYLENGRPTKAYWVVERDISNLGKIYTHPDLFDLMEMLALAAGDEIMPGLRRPMRALDHLEQRRVDYDALWKRIPGWYNNVYLCFYEQGPHPKWSVPYLWGTVVLQVKLDAQGRIDLRNAERHQVAVPPQAVVQEEMPERYSALAMILLVMSIDECKKELGRIPDSLALTEPLIGMRLRHKWDNNLSADDKDFLDNFYRSAVGGSLHTLFSK